MNSYYLNTNTGEVHRSGCAHLNNTNYEHRHYLGFHSSAKAAVKAAKQIQKNADGCYYCCLAAHTC